MAATEMDVFLLEQDIRRAIHETGLNWAQTYAIFSMLLMELDENMREDIRRHAAIQRGE